MRKTGLRHKYRLNSKVNLNELVYLAKDTWKTCCGLITLNFKSYEKYRTYLKCLVCKNTE